MISQHISLFGGTRPPASRKMCIEKALLFGFNTWAEYRLQNRMAKSPKNVALMYESLIPKLQKAAEVEKSELAIDNIEISDITPWDIRYFISKERSKVSSIENSELKKFLCIFIFES